jgi:hypothetical protein
MVSYRFVALAAAASLAAPFESVDAVYSMAGCYCKSLLTQKIQEIGYSAAWEYIQANEAETCNTVVTNIALSGSFGLLATLMVVVVNVVLQALIKILVRFEKHVSASQETKATVEKVFVAQFINTSIVILIVNANYKAFSNTNILGFLGLFQGAFEDFSPDWYKQVGGTLMSTMLINIFVPHLAPLLGLYIIAPLKRSLTASGKNTQETLNELYMGPDFPITIRTAQILTCVFVCMMYAPGLPLMMPIAMCSMIMTFFVDKLLLIKFYRRPPRFDESTVSLCIGFIPAAVGLRLIIGCWMLGNSELLRSGFMGGLLDPTASEEEQTKTIEDIKNMDPLGIAARVMRQNVFPLLVLLGLMIAMEFLKRTPLFKAFSVLIRNLLYMPIKKCAEVICSCVPPVKHYINAHKPAIHKLAEDQDLGNVSSSTLPKVTQKKRLVFLHDNKEFVPPWTEAFEQEMNPLDYMDGDKSGQPMEIHSVEEMQGWKDWSSLESNEKKDGKTLRTKVWLKDDAETGAKKGDMKKTWIAVRDDGYHTYSIKENRKYGPLYKLLPSTKQIEI